VSSPRCTRSSRSRSRSPCAAARIGARDLARGIAALRAEAERIALGDLTRSEIFESEDELGDLARDFDRMRQALRDTVRRVADAADRVDAASGQLAVVGGSVAEGAAEQERCIAQASESTASIRERVTASPARRRRSRLRSKSRRARSWRWVRPVKS